MRYQVITWTRGEGHDERRKFSTLAEASAAARIYRRECDGVGIYDCMIFTFCMILSSGPYINA